MGRKLKFTSDPSLAKPHEVGANVACVQPVLHHTYGVINFLWPIYWTFHLDIAEKDYQRLRGYDTEILKLEVHPSKSRLISDMKLLSKLYETGVSMTTNVVLTVEHLTLEIERTTKQRVPGKPTLGERFLGSLKTVGFRDISSYTGHSKFVEIQAMRDSFMHPKEENIYDASENGWDKVPLAWVVSGKCLLAYAKYRELISEVINYWEIKKKDYERPGVLNVIRGLKHLHDVKLPPKRN